MPDSILLTFDVEDWFQVENFKNHIEFSAWNSFEPRVEKNTLKILDLLDSFRFRPKATFFVLGWIAEKLPGLVREIHKRGHEVASHGFNHHLCGNLEKDELAQDLEKSRKILEDLTGADVYGFRAPSFAIDDNILSVIADAGYTYDSSFNSFSGHGRYGKIDLTGAEKKNALYKVNEGFFEIPVSNLHAGSTVFPLGGGGYFRLVPFFIFRAGMESVLKKDHAFVFYAHPWEFDPGQPRVEQAPKWFKFRHYVNLGKTRAKLECLLESFHDHRFMTCMDYVRYNC